MRGIRKSFAATRALDGVDLDLHAGEALALIGENGAGKSTLMKILSGAISPDAGTIELDGVAYAPGDPLAAAGHGVAMIYQELCLAAHLTVAENIVLGREPRRRGVVDRAAMRQRAGAALAQLGHEDIAVDAVVGALPVAQQQMVEIARALDRQPRVLVMDEPTSSLTRRDTQRLFAAIQRLKAQGVAIVYISHFLEEAQAVAERYTVLRDGRSVGGGAMAAASVADLIRLMVGREVAEIYPRVPHAIGAPVLEVQALRGAARPLDAGFTLHRGEILGLFGLVGAGRSECLRALFGLDPVRAGRVLLDGGEATRTTPWQRLRAKIGLVSEDRKGEGLLLGRPIADNLTLTDLRRHATAGVIDQAALDRVTGEWITLLGVRCAGPRQAIGELSGGNQQKVAIGRLLHHGARVLLLDEPTRGVDVNAKAAIYRLIGDLAAQGCAILVVSSYLPELLGICDSIAAMCRGVLGPVRPVAQWSETTLLAAAIGQEAAA